MSVDLMGRVLERRMEPLEKFVLLMIAECTSSGSGSDGEIEHVFHSAAMSAVRDLTCLPLRQLSAIVRSLEAGGYLRRSEPSEFDWMDKPEGTIFYRVHHQPVTNVVQLRQKELAL